MTLITPTTKPHYPILDGLRGVAAVMVVMMHLCEANSTSPFDMVINHGYLAVDFFFLLSGFVIGYAYDDRWNKMSVGGFFKRRLIRLQPMVIIGMIIGAVGFYFQASSLWPSISNTPVWQMLLIMLIGCTMLPVPPAMDIRGWQEMYPVNGPAWSLFYEYVANILYGLFVRKFPKWMLTTLVLLSAIFLLHLALTSKEGDLIGGWSLAPEQLHIGFARVMYPFFAGLLLFRISRLAKIPHAFIWCSLMIIVIFAMPRIGGREHLWMNAVYESISVIVLFPLVIYLGASGEIKNPFQVKLCKFLGDISYPIYITHYPLIYWYTGWVHDIHPNAMSAFLVAGIVLASAITIGYTTLKLFDEPVRKWLQKKFYRMSVVAKSV